MSGDSPLSRALDGLDYDFNMWNFPFTKKRYSDVIDRRYKCTRCGITGERGHKCRENPLICEHPSMPHHNLKFEKMVLDKFVKINDVQPITIRIFDLNSILANFKRVQFSTYLPGTKTHVETDFWVLILKLRNTTGFHKMMKLHKTDPYIWVFRVGDDQIGEQIEFVKKWYYNVMITISRVFKKFYLVKDIRVLLYREYIQQFSVIKQSKIEAMRVFNEEFIKAVRQMVWRN